MAKKNTIKDSPKKVMLQMIEKNLESLLIKLNPKIGEKKIRKRIRLAGKILIKGINTKMVETGNTNNLNETVASA